MITASVETRVWDQPFKKEKLKSREEWEKYLSVPVLGMKWRQQFNRSFRMRSGDCEHWIWGFLQANRMQRWLWSCPGRPQTAFVWCLSSANWDPWGIYSLSRRSSLRSSLLSPHSPLSFCLFIPPALLLYLQDLSMFSTPLSRFRPNYQTLVFMRDENHDKVLFY